MHFLLHSSAIYVQNNNLCKFWNNVFPSSVFVAKFADRRLNLKQIYWMLFGTSLGNPFLLNVIWDYSGETISKNQNMDYSGETIFKKKISEAILGKPFRRTKIWTILGKPFLKTNIWDHSADQFSATLSYPSTSCKTKFGAILRYEVFGPGTSVLPPPGRPP